MITLNLKSWAPVRRCPEEPEARAVQLAALERDVHRAFDDLSALLGHVREKTVYIPTELLFDALQGLMPPERMGTIGGMHIGHHYLMGLIHDVTGRANRAHVEADPDKLGRALVSFDRRGLRLAGWIHSHPGTGPAATAPSETDWAQYRDWTHDFDPLLVGLIVVRDGYARAWGHAVEDNRIRLELVGDGVTPVAGYRHVYKIGV